MNFWILVQLILVLYPNTALVQLVPIVMVSYPNETLVQNFAQTPILHKRPNPALFLKVA